jgi:hypothetical protein
VYSLPLFAIVNLFTSTGRPLFKERQTDFYILKIALYEKNRSEMYQIKLVLHYGLHAIHALPNSHRISRRVSRPKHVQLSGEGFS